MAVGSGLFSKNVSSDIPHLGQNHSVGDLRADVNAALSPLAAIAVQEWTNPAATSATALLAATATTVAVQSYAPAQLVAGGVAALLAFPRTITFTTAGTTPADAPATVVVTGTDINDTAQSETVTVSQTAATVSTVKAYKTVKSIVYAAGDGTGATISIGIGSAFGLHKTPKSRAGLAGCVREISAGAVVTNGTLSATNKTYTPNAAPNGSTSYAAYYEFDATL